MPSRGEDSTSNRPRRAKSTTSIKSRQSISVDQETIDQHALTAAALAFERANGRVMAFKMSPGREVTATSKADKPHLTRKQSVRFVGPTAMPTRQRSITRREALAYRHNVGGSQKGTFEDEYLDSEVASMPSSYKRIRKAKSMYSPRNVRACQSMHQTPGTGFHTRIHSEQSSDSVTRLSQLPKPSFQRSFSFLRGKSDCLSSNTRQNASTDAAIQMARDQYLRQLEQQRLKAKPSVLTLGKRHKSQKAFRRTVRTSSTNSYGSAVASTSPNPTELYVARGLGHRARSISSSLKSKLKRVFQRPSDVQEVMPAQQLNATRLHFGEYNATSSGLEQHYEGIPSPDCETLRRVNSRESPLRNSPVILERGSPAGSIRSDHSADSISNGKSRVTSWTNSTAANTLSSRQKLERKRLSIIQENGGPHQPSSSGRQYGELVDSSTVFHKAVGSNRLGDRTRGLVDSQRLYSALQKRFGEKGHQALHEQDNSTTDVSNQTRFHLSDLTPRKSSIKGSRDTSDSLEATNAKYSPDFPRGMKHSTSVVFKPLISANADDVFSPTQDVSPQKTFDEQVGRSPRGIAPHDEIKHSDLKRPLREVKSGFFPSNIRLERSKTSPFRRVMHTKNESEASAEETFQSPGYPDRSLIPQPCPTIYGFHNGSVIGSESVYSRTPSGNTPKPFESSLSLAGSEVLGEMGTAFIITSPSGKYTESSMPFAQRNISSTKSSGDWQNWMASKVATLESRGMGNSRTEDAHPSEGIGHKRENAQLDNEDVGLGKLAGSHNAPKQPLAVIHNKMATRATLERKTFCSMKDRFPLLDIAPASNFSIRKQDESATNKSSTGQARSPSNIENERYSSSVSRPHASSSDLRKKVSSTSLRSHRKASNTLRYQAKCISTDSPNSQETLTPASIRGNLRVKTKPTTPSRHSPERLARLRRMRSTTSLGSSSNGKPRSGAAQPQIEVKAPDNLESPLPDSRCEGLDFRGECSGLASNDTLVTDTHNLVDLFLSKRRRNTKSSQDSGGDPAFL